MGIIINKVREGRVLVSDGAWGTFLHQKGLKADECPEAWNTERPEDVYDIARSYVEAGSDIVLTNSFGGSPLKLKGYGLEDLAYELNREAARISKKAAGNRALVMGSIGPTGKMVMMGEVPTEELMEGFRQQAAGLADGGADGIVVETMADPEEARIAVRAAKEATSLDVACTFTFSATQTGEYRTMMGTGVEEYLQMVREEGVDVAGANCGNGSEGMIAIVGEMRKLDRDIPLLVHANAGLPVYRDGATVFPESPEEMADQVKGLVEAGASIIGGCCGTTPEHIRLIASAIQKVKLHKNL